MKAILRFFSRITHHIYRSVKEIIESNSRELKTAPWSLRVVAYFIIGLFTWSVFYYTLHALVLVVSVSINTIFISRIFHTDQISKNKIVQDFSRPVIGMGIFALASLLYFTMPEITILLSFFVIPQLFGEITRKYKEYQHALA